jgi:hypothetical protein
VTVGGVDVGVRLRLVLLVRIELGDLRRDGREQPEAERRSAQDAEDEQEGEESELADAPTLRSPPISPEERQNRGSLARQWALRNSRGTP